MQEAQTSPASERASSYLPIEDYAVIGDLHTVALVGKNGSIDWCCLPRFDSPSVFGALLDAGKGGFFRISPTAMEGIACKQLYLPESNLLLTRFLAESGVGEVTDFMPIKQVGTAQHEHQIIRSVAMVHGSLSFTLDCRPAFNYARDTHRLDITQQGALFQSQHFCLELASPLSLEPDGQGGVQASFTLHAGQAVHFLLRSSREGGQASQELTEDQYQAAFHDTLHYWHTTGSPRAPTRGDGGRWSSDRHLS